jgi:hypothetical protein
MQVATSYITKQNWGFFGLTKLGFSQTKTKKQRNIKGKIVKNKKNSINKIS